MSALTLAVTLVVDAAEDDGATTTSEILDAVVEMSDDRLDKITDGMAGYSAEQFRAEIVAALGPVTFAPDPGQADAIDAAIDAAKTVESGVWSDAWLTADDRRAWR